MYDSGNILELELESKREMEKIRELETKLLMVDYKKKNNVEDSDICIVCLKKERDTVYTACMHLSCCYDCYRKTGDKWPLCREQSAYKRVYIPWEFSLEIFCENFCRGSFQFISLWHWDRTLTAASDSDRIPTENLFWLDFYR